MPVFIWLSLIELPVFISCADFAIAILREGENYQQSDKHFFLLPFEIGLHFCIFRSEVKTEDRKPNALDLLLISPKRGNTCSDARPLRSECDVIFLTVDWLIDRMTWNPQFWLAGRLRRWFQHLEAFVTSVIGPNSFHFSKMIKSIQRSRDPWSRCWFNN